MTEKPLHADAAHNRARILATATEVFAAKGPAASTEEIAAHTVVTLLSRDVTAAPALAGPNDAVATLLENDQTRARVRPEIHLDEVTALLTAASQGALTAAWPAGLQARTLAAIFTGLRP
ncbi:SbtR family transcriptional regulator [Catenuloplanes indicus]|uniref:Transcriptional regulator SbtR-like C-terminal domain-containing protein n=1 Tax=Catenuloplanes indicus TaxID=137267 RepID=A0AAE3W0G3_9ACTN|nr:hypothetical protein [Catenuloplanes indicus]MDQ0367206.1 hypothetical protein [Catenuloplanes indicus]